MDNSDFQNIILTELERKDLILTLACINDCFDLKLINSHIVNISTSDGIDINIDFNDKKSQSSKILKEIIEYSYNYRHYDCDSISNDEDALSCIFKFANAIVLDINKEGNDKISTKKSNHPTPLQLSIFHRIIMLEELTYQVYEKNQNTYSAFLIARYIAESIQQAQLFVHNLELLDFIHVIDTFSSIIPNQEDNRWIEFVSQILDYSNNNAK